MQCGSGHNPPSGQQETVLLSEPGLQVTTARLVVGDLTYPIATITSVAPFTVRADMRGPNAAVFLGLVVNLAAILGIKVGTENKGGWLFVVATNGSIAFCWAGAAGAPPREAAMSATALAASSMGGGGSPCDAPSLSTETK